MFNFEEMDNVTNKSVRSVIQSSDIIVMGGNKMRLSVEAAEKIGLTADRNILVVSGGQKLAIATTSEEKQGRPVNAKREFSHQAIAALLGGRYSEWAITGDGQDHPVTGDKYFELNEIVNGAKVIADLEVKAETLLDPVDTEVEEPTSWTPDNLDLEQEPQVEAQQDADFSQEETVTQFHTEA